jgi:hypothetical protein
MFKKETSGKLCIVNIQETPLDEYADIRINYFCDEVFELLAKRMRVVIDPRDVRYLLQVELKKDVLGGYEIILEGKGKEGHNLTFMREVRVKMRGGEIFGIEIRGHQCAIPLPSLQE